VTYFRYLNIKHVAYSAVGHRRLRGAFRVSIAGPRSATSIPFREYKAHFPGKKPFASSAKNAGDPSRGIIPAKFEPRRKTGRFACVASLAERSAEHRREKEEKKRRERERERERGSNSERATITFAKREWPELAARDPRKLRFASARAIMPAMDRCFLVHRVNRPEGPHFAERNGACPIPRGGRPFKSSDFSAPAMNKTARRTD